MKLYPIHETVILLVTLVQSRLDHRVCTFAKQRDLVRLKVLHDHRHAFSTTREFKNVQDFVAEESSISSSSDSDHPFDVFTFKAETFVV